MNNAFIVTTPGQRSQRVEFDGTSEFAAIRAHREARKLATHKYAQICVEHEIEGFDVPAYRQIRFSHVRPALSFGCAMQLVRGQRSRREFSARIKVSRSRLSQWEAGLVVPTTERLHELCEALPGLWELMRGERRAG